MPPAPTHRALPGDEFAVLRGWTSNLPPRSCPRNTAKGERLRACTLTNSAPQCTARRIRSLPRAAEAGSPAPVPTSRRPARRKADRADRAMPLPAAPPVQADRIAPMILNSIIYPHTPGTPRDGAAHARCGIDSAIRHGWAVRAHSTRRQQQNELCAKLRAEQYPSIGGAAQHSRYADAGNQKRRAQAADADHQPLELAAPQP